MTASDIPHRLAALGLVTVEHCGSQVGPEDVLSAGVQLTWEALATLLGRPELAGPPIFEDGTSAP